MGVRPVIRVFRLALLLLAAGCHLPDASRSEVTVARAAAPDAPPTNLPAITEPPGSLPVRPASAVQPKSVSPGEFLPPIPALPDAPPLKPKAAAPPPTSDAPPVARPRRRPG